MKILGMIFLLLVARASAQVASSGSMTATAATCTPGVCVSLHLTNSPTAPTSSANISLTGTFVATVSFEASPDGGVTWVAMNGTPSNSSTPAATAAAAGVWLFHVGSLTDLRARCSAYTSGTALATMVASPAAP